VQRHSPRGLRRSSRPAAALLRLLLGLRLRRLGFSSGRSPKGPRPGSWVRVRPGFSGFGGVWAWGRTILPLRGQRFFLLVDRATRRKNPCPSALMGGRWPALPRPPKVGDPRIRASYPRATYLPSAGNARHLPPRAEADARSCVRALGPERCCVHDRIPTRTQHPSPSSTRRKNPASTAHQHRTLRHPRTPASPRTQPGRAPNSPVEALSETEPARSRGDAAAGREGVEGRSRRTRRSRGDAAAGLEGVEEAQPQDDEKPRSAPGGREEAGAAQPQGRGKAHPQNRPHPPR
jgi:hypothetical protein